MAISDMTQEIPSETMGIRESEKILPQFRPQILDFEEHRKELQDQPTNERHQKEDEENKPLLDKTREGIVAMLTDYFHMKPEDVETIEIPNYQIDKERRCFAWIAMYHPRTKKIYFASGRANHSTLFTKICLKAGLTDEEVTPIYHRLMAPADPRETFDPNQPLGIRGLYSADSFHRIVPQYFSERTHAIYQKPLPAQEGSDVSTQQAA
ncbi:MAG: hypothetical protein HYZ08_02825 [Candidatus Kerfeldbacteria bacterium]|nr:hypothetical protein [Candidatus Kerfeldbacteria bacterium]